MSDASDQDDDQPEAPSVYPVLRWTIPIHALLPVLIGLTFEATTPEVAEAIVTWSWMVLHIGFPLFLALSYPLWRGRGEEVFAVIVINHVVTFAVGVALIAWWPG